MVFARKRKLLRQIETAQWERIGKVIRRGDTGNFDASVTGNPCIVWDDTVETFRMFYFAQRKVSGKEINSNAHALLIESDPSSLGTWLKLGLLNYENPEDLAGHTHKPWVVMDAYRPNYPAKINGKNWLFTSSFRGNHKVLQVAKAETLAGPWHVQPECVIDLGPEGAIDEYHAEGATAFWFAKQQKILIFYMAYPRRPQTDQPHSPYGHSNVVAEMGYSDTNAHRLGKALAPYAKPGHWAAGYINGIQLIPATQGGWYGILNASPTPPPSPEVEPEVREPAPSLPGWAYTPKTWPVSGWQLMDEPLEWLEQIPEDARLNGEGSNLWRHHLFFHPSGELFVLYNTGSYGEERMFAKRLLEPQKYIVVDEN